MTILYCMNVTKKKKNVNKIYLNIFISMICIGINNKLKNIFIIAIKYLINRFFFIIVYT
jgi:hypothetical protein